MIRCCTLFLATALATVAFSDFSISVTFDPGVDEQYKAAFNSAASFWESQITGYRQDAFTVPPVDITASVAENDGVGGILGSAGPSTYYAFSGTLDGDSASSHVAYSASGTMSFDSADVDNLISGGSWESVIRHEMAHVLGFGTLWGYSNGSTTFNDFYTDGSGQYTGAAALAAYQAEFDPLATYVPVELGGGSGTANGHWNEVLGGAAATGITDAGGNDMQDELMTGWLNTPSFVSQTTLGQFYDMGYTVIPEPASILTFTLFGVAGLWVRRLFLI